MSLFRGALRPPPIASDEAVRRHLESIRARLGPDPAFRQRLRGEMLSRYIVARDQAEASRHPIPRALRVAMRASLYASVAVGFSVGGVMAVSQSTVPGDLLYPVKREIEALRVSVLPASFHDDLARWALAERITELGRLVEAGDLERATAMAGPIQAQVTAMTAMGIAPSESDTALSGPIHVLAGLVASLPSEAAAAIEDALASAPGLVRAAGAGTAGDGGGNGNPDGGGGNGNANGGGVPGAPGGGGNGSASGAGNGGGSSGEDGNPNSGPGNNTGSDNGSEPSGTDETPGVDDTPAANGSPNPGSGAGGGNGGNGGDNGNPTKTPKPKPSPSASTVP